MPSSDFRSSSDVVNNVINLRFTGAFSLAASVSLAASASFVKSFPSSPAGTLDLAFPLEGSWSTVGVRVDQHDGGVRASIFANPDGAAAEDVRAQVERILSLDSDGAGFAHIAARDDVILELQQRHPGLRPVLFPSPYEAAARAIIGHRLPVRYAATLSDRIAEEHGASVDAGDDRMHAFPAPDRLAELPLVTGLAARKVEQLHALGIAAADGRFSTALLRKMDRDEALSHLQQLPGIGPFSAELVLLRGVGDPDAFPLQEKRLHRAMAAAYHLGDEPDLDALKQIAERWRPYRGWVGLLLRNF